MKIIRRANDNIYEIIQFDHYNLPSSKEIVLFHISTSIAMQSNSNINKSYFIHVCLYTFIKSDDSFQFFKMIFRKIAVSGPSEGPCVSSFEFTPHNTPPLLAPMD